MGIDKIMDKDKCPICGQVFIGWQKNQLCKHFQVRMVIRDMMYELKAREDED